MSTRSARNAVAWAFVLNGFAFATLASRVPSLRSGLSLGNGSLGLLLLTAGLGSGVGLPLSGRLIERYGTAWVVRVGAGSCAVGFVAAGLGVGAGSVAVTAAGLASYGLGTGIWDVAMNVAGSRVEQDLGRTILPRFHAGWSLGSFAGAGLAALLVRVHVPVSVHLPAVMVVGALAAVLVAEAFPAGGDHTAPPAEGGSAWREGRTLFIGFMVLAFALAEGSGNDWLALALVDDHGVAPYVGAAGFGLFVAAMTLGRLAGPPWLDRHGSLPVLLASAASAALGIVALVFGSGPLVPAGIVAWGLGAALGFPVGISLAARDPRRAARRVSVVSTIGYAAFLTGPPLLGFVGDHTSTARSLLVVVVLMAPAGLLAVAAHRR